MTKKIEYTRHAIEKMAERGIRKNWVERAIREPLWVEPEIRYIDARRCFVDISEFGGRHLRVVCIETQDTIRVITATFDRGARSRQ